MTKSNISIKNRNDFIPIVALILILMIVIVTVVFIMLTRQNTNPQQSSQPETTSSPNQAQVIKDVKKSDDSISETTPQNNTEITTTPSPTFDIEEFYSKVQVGMSPDEVIKTAGKQPSDCASTGSVPPSETCFWYIGNKTVAVSFGNKSVVQAKSKSGF